MTRAAALMNSMFALTLAGTIPARAATQPASPAVGPQYDTMHVYVAPDQVDGFVTSFITTFGGASTKQVVATVTPTASSTTSQLVQTPVGTVSVFGFKTGIPYPFGAERTGYLVHDLDAAVKAAQSAGADVQVTPFPDPIGRDAVVQWPGGVTMQLYWHTNAPDYPALQTIPEHRVYVSADRVGAFVKSFLAFSKGRVVSDVTAAPGDEIGESGHTVHRIRLDSTFGHMAVFVTDGHLPYPYGREVAGYEVVDLKDTLGKATSAGATVLVEPVALADRSSAMVAFPGGYISEIHELNRH